MHCIKVQQGRDAGGNFYQYPCGQCMPCRIRRRNEWAARIVLEWLATGSGTFGTLTYEVAPRELVPEDLTNFFKRLRKVKKFRYFAVGEYGERTGRPHYHVCLFGLGLDDYDLVKEKWGHGFIQLSELNPARARYAARYTTKKLIGAETGPMREFARMSRRPALGLTYCTRLVECIKRSSYFAQLVQGRTKENSWKYMPLVDGVTPSFVRLQGKYWPLDRTMRLHINRELGGSATVAGASIRLQHSKFMAKSLDDHTEGVVYCAEREDLLIKRSARERQAQGVM